MPVQPKLDTPATPEPFRYPDFYKTETYVVPNLREGLTFQRAARFLQEAVLCFFTADRKKLEDSEARALYRIMEDNAAKLIEIASLVAPRAPADAACFYRVSIFALNADWDGAVELYRQFGARARAFYQVAGSGAVELHANVAQWILEFEGKHGQCSTGLLAHLLRMEPAVNAGPIAALVDASGEGFKRTILDVDPKRFRQDPTYIVSLCTEFGTLGALFGTLLTDDAPKFSPEEIELLRSSTEQVSCDSDRDALTTAIRTSPNKALFRKDLPTLVGLMKALAPSAVLLHLSRPGEMDWVAANRMNVVRRGFDELRRFDAEHELGGLLSAVDWADETAIGSVADRYVRRAHGFSPAPFVLASPHFLAGYGALVAEIRRRNGISADAVLDSLRPHHLKIGVDNLADACAVMAHRAPAALKYASPEHFEDTDLFRYQLREFGHHYWGVLVGSKRPERESSKMLRTYSALLGDGLGDFLASVPREEWGHEEVGRGVEVFRASFGILWRKFGKECLSFLRPLSGIVSEAREALGTERWDRFLRRSRRSGRFSVPLIELSLTNLGSKNDFREPFFCLGAWYDPTGAIEDLPSKIAATGAGKGTRLIFFEAGSNPAAEDRIRTAVDRIGRKAKYGVFAAHGNGDELVWSGGRPTFAGMDYPYEGRFHKRNYQRIRSLFSYFEDGGHIGIGSCSSAEGGPKADNLLVACSREAAHLNFAGVSCFGGIRGYRDVPDSSDTPFVFGTPRKNVVMIKARITGPANAGEIP